jgi:hypothetical protein
VVRPRVGSGVIPTEVTVKRLHFNSRVCFDRQGSGIGGSVCSGGGHCNGGDCGVVVV